jgi:hypothetical protein
MDKRKEKMKEDILIIQFSIAGISSPKGIKQSGHQY